MTESSWPRYGFEIGCLMICKFGLDGGGGGGGEGERGGLLEFLSRGGRNFVPIFGKSWAHEGRSDINKRSKGGEDRGGSTNNEAELASSRSAKETDFRLFLGVSLGDDVAMDCRNFLIFALSFDDGDDFLASCLPLLT